MSRELLSTESQIDSYEATRIFLAELECKWVLEYTEVAFYLGNRSKRYVEELVRSGKLISQSPGRVSRAELERYVDRADQEASRPHFKAATPTVRPKRKSSRRGGS